MTRWIDWNNSWRRYLTWRSAYLTVTYKGTYTCLLILLSVWPHWLYILISHDQIRLNCVEYGRGKGLCNWTSPQKALNGRSLANWILETLWDETFDPWCVPWACSLLRELSVHGRCSLLREDVRSGVGRSWSVLSATPEQFPLAFLSGNGTGDYQLCDENTGPKGRWGFNKTSVIVWLNSSLRLGIFH